MGRPKKHIAVQNEFEFGMPIPTEKSQESEFEKSLKACINILNNPITPKTQKIIKNSVENLHKMQDNPIINQALAQELQLTTPNQPEFINTIVTGTPVIQTYTQTYNEPCRTGTANEKILICSNLDTNRTNDNPLNKNCVPPQKLTRNSHGLYTHVNYIFNEEGFVNWRAMIPIKYLYVGDNIKGNTMRREMFEKKYGKKPENIDLAVDKVEDKDLLITLAGIRYLAMLRGYESLRFEVLPSSNQGYVIVNCSVSWVRNFETSVEQYCVVSFSAVACASPETTNGGFKNYLPEIASNRAFCRAVRNFLNIDVLSDEENFDKKEDPKAPAANGVTPYGDPKEMLKAKLEERGWTFEKLKEGMIKKDKEWEKYAAIIEVPSIKIFDVLGRLKQKEEKEKNPVPE